MDDFKRLVRTLDQIRQFSALSDETALRALAVARVVAGQDPSSVASESGFSARYLASRSQEVGRDGLKALFKDLHERTAAVKADRVRKGIAQMCLGAIAEKHFETIAHEMTGGRDLTIEDHRPTRSDTDYRLMNGQGQPVFRMNIKFHGTLFRQAHEQVGLDPSDCFPLATYKIHNALQKQAEEKLPYVFFVLSVPGLTADSVAQLIPANYVWAQCVIRGRSLEESIVEANFSEQHRATFTHVLDQVKNAEFRVISAARAERILKEMLFDRVFALRQRAFTRNYRNAEIDLHISLSREMTPVREFFEIVARESLQKIAILLWSGQL